MLTLGVEPTNWMVMESIIVLTLGVEPAVFVAATECLHVWVPPSVLA